MCVKHFPLEFTLKMRPIWYRILKLPLYFPWSRQRNGSWAMESYRLLFSTNMILLPCAKSSTKGYVMKIQATFRTALYFLEKGTMVVCASKLPNQVPEKESRLCAKFVVLTLPSLTRGKTWCCRLKSSCNNWKKGKFVTWDQVMLDKLPGWCEVGAVSTNFYHKHYKGRTILVPWIEFSILPSLGDDILVLWTKISPRSFYSRDLG